MLRVNLSLDDSYFGLAIFLWVSKSFQLFWASDIFVGVQEFSLMKTLNT